MGRGLSDTSGDPRGYGQNPMGAKNEHERQALTGRVHPDACTHPVGQRRDTSWRTDTGRHHQEFCVGCETTVAEYDTVENTPARGTS